MPSSDDALARVDWPTVSVVMPIRNEAAHLGAAVSAVLEQRYPIPFDICLAIGPSDDGTEHVAEALSASNDRVVLVDNPSGRTPAGLNAAIRATNGDVIVRVDGHSELSPGYITRAVATLLDTGSVNVGGVQRAVGRSPFEAAVAAAMTSTFGTGGARFHVGGDPGPVDTVYLGVFRRSAGDAAGWFDESLIRNQDYELNIRLRAAGGVVWFDPELAVTYRPRPSIGALARQYFEYGEWKAVVIRRYPDSAKLRQVVPAAATALLAMSVVIVPWRRRAAIVPLTYVAAVVMEATRLARDRRVGLLHLVRIFPAMQLGWGFGFLVGLRRWFTRSVGGPAASAATPSAT